VAPHLDELAARTPPSRDRYVDFLRAASILAVVVGHWMIMIIWWQRGLIRNTSAIGVTRGLWLATWVFQVMPVFFFVGGFSNLVALDASRRSGDSTWRFVRSRVERLLRPSLVFLGVWLVVQVVLHLADVGTSSGMTLWGHTRMLRGVRPPGTTIPFGPLWFLAVYLIVVSISPWTVALHRRFGLWVPAAMAAGAVAVDVVAFGFGHPSLRWANVAFVLLLPHQLGHFYGDGRMLRWPRWTFVAMAAGGLALLVVLTNPWVFRPFGARRFDWFPTIGYYPKSLLGTDVEPISNAYPPTVPFMAMAFWSIGAVMLLRPRLSRWLQRLRPWKATIAVNAVIMTVFLWHMTAYLLAVLVLWPLGFGHQHVGNARWWLERPLWILVPGVILLGLIRVFGRFERARPRAPAGPGTRGPARARTPLEAPSPRPSGGP
jgi:fucose 4-O-acetylase-like acetyltransferase